MIPQSTLSGGFKVTLVGVIVNIVLAIIKFIAGILGNSAAMVADAIHSLSDLVTDVVVYISLKISSAAPDEDHPYGHGRAETIGAAVIGVFIVFVGLGIAWTVLTKVVGGEASSPTYIALVGAIVSLIAKEILYHYTIRAGRELRSDSIIANAWHHRSDALSSLAAFVGIGATFFGYPLMDPLAAVVVGLMVSGSGAKISWDAVQNLMDTSASPEELKEIEEIIKKRADIHHFHELKTRKVGKDAFVDIHIQVSPRISISEAHNISESLRYELRKKIDYVTDALVHIDAEDDREGRLYSVDRSQIEETVKEALKEFSGLNMNSDMTLHYFLHQICVELTVTVDEKLDAAETKREVESLVNKILENPSITEVTVKQDLGGKQKENQQT